MSCFAELGFEISGKCSAAQGVKQAITLHKIVEHMCSSLSGHFTLIRVGVRSRNSITIRC